MGNSYLSLSHTFTQLPLKPILILILVSCCFLFSFQGSYEDLYATRFFGGLVFYLACVVRLDGLLLDRLRREKFADAADVVRLLNILHPKCKCALAAGEARGTDDLGLLQTYIKTTAVARLKDRLTGLLSSVSSVEEDDPADERLSV